MVSKKNTTAFTLSEILLALSLFTIIVGLFLVFSSSFQKQTELNVATTEIVNALRQARDHTINGKSNTTFGLHLENRAYTLFSGPAFDRQNPANEVIMLPSILAITDINLTGGADIIFLKPYGVTNQAGSFKIIGPGNTQRQIQINAAGIVTWQ